MVSEDGSSSGLWRGVGGGGQSDWNQPPSTSKPSSSAATANWASSVTKGRVLGSKSASTSAAARLVGLRARWSRAAFVFVDDIRQLFESIVTRVDFTLCGVSEEFIVLLLCVSPLLGVCFFEQSSLDAPVPGGKLLEEDADHGNDDHGG